MEIKVGMRVCFSREFLSNTGQVTGPEAPASYGPFAEGKVISLWMDPDDEKVLAFIMWDDGIESHANTKFLWDATKKHMEPA